MLCHLREERATFPFFSSLLERARRMHFSRSLIDFVLVFSVNPVFWLGLVHSFAIVSLVR